MPLDPPAPTVGWRTNRLKNTGIPPPAPQKQVGPPLPKSMWPANFKTSKARFGVASDHKWPQGGRTL